MKARRPKSGPHVRDLSSWTPRAAVLAAEGKIRDNDVDGVLTRVWCGGTLMTSFLMFLHEDRREARGSAALLCEEMKRKSQQLHA